MSFLSLGLKSDEQQEETARDDSAVLGLNPASKIAANHSNQSTDRGDAGIRTEAPEAVGERHILREPGNGFASAHGDDDSEDDQSSNLPPAVEELRRKLAGNGYKPTFRRVVNDATPTFTTFQFGYLPGRGLLYSLIAHEIVLFGLFLLVHYG